MPALNFIVLFTFIPWVLSEDEVCCLPCLLLSVWTQKLITYIICRTGIMSNTQAVYKVALSVRDTLLQQLHQLLIEPFSWPRLASGGCFNLAPGAL